MSVITNIILLCNENKDSSAVNNLNKWLKKEGHGQLVEVSRCQKGHKHMYIDVWIMAANFFTLEAFGEEFQKQVWTSPGIAKLLFQNEHDENWITYDARTSQLFEYRQMHDDIYYLKEKATNDS